MRLIRMVPLLALVPSLAAAQNFRNDDAVIRRMYDEGIQRSQTERLAQVLMDSIGPRLAGSQGFVSAVDWLASVYESWGITARKENYGTWRGWRQGAVHMELTAPRVQNLEVELLAWSPGTNGRPAEGAVAVIPELADSGAGNTWLASVRGKFVLASAPEAMCRANQELERFARASTVTQLRTARANTQRDFATNVTRGLGGFGQLHRKLEEAGALGIVTLTWSAGWGANKIHNATVERIPTVDLSCEDYGLVYRLASNNQGPRLRLTADAQIGPAAVPMFNVVAELRGGELPNEYVVLSAHLDSWAGATGATDNGTGTIMMLEAMRILKASYPNPRRTILVGHWGAEEMGLVGSRAFTEDHPEVIQGLQAAFNQDNGTWRVDYIQAQGFTSAGANIARWLSRLPSDMTDSIRLHVPGPQGDGGSDHSSFLCHGAPGFRLQASYPEYRQYTWHTNRDTFDKIVFDDLKFNATLAAMLAYAASEDPERVSRDRTTLPAGPNGQPRAWPTCPPVRRAYSR